MMKKTSRAFLVTAFALALLMAALPVTAQTFLLVVREKADARPLPPPFAVREGISAGLFDAGFIVLDAPGSTPLPGAAELSKIARAAGADMVVVVATEYTDTQLGVDLLRVTARTSFTLIDASTSGIVTQGTRAATNKDREREVGRDLLGAEIGRDVVQQVQKALSRRSGGVS